MLSLAYKIPLLNQPTYPYKLLTIHSTHCTLRDRIRRPGVPFECQRHHVQNFSRHTVCSATVIILYGRVLQKNFISQRYLHASPESAPFQLSPGQFQKRLSINLEALFKLFIRVGLIVFTNSMFYCANRDNHELNCLIEISTDCLEKV
jgi:hypothetical protein